MKVLICDRYLFLGEVLKNEIQDNFISFEIYIEISNKFDLLDLSNFDLVLVDIDRSFQEILIFVQNYSKVKFIFYNQNRFEYGNNFVLLDKSYHVKDIINLITFLLNISFY